MPAEITKQRVPTVRARIPEERIYVPPQAAERCRNVCASNSFVQWQEQTLTPSFNWELNFEVPSGKQAVIELITATIQVPQGEWVRMRLFTSIGSAPGNFDLTLKPQGTVGGNTIYVATHSLKLYTDSLLAININRDNAETTGDALVCIGGYLLG